uniref:Uncharacterized protein n=1 Tax=Anguilla anguilla TaxID=7936 RepID=A0A0E9XU50_ANGAN
MVARLVQQTETDRFWKQFLHISLSLETQSRN